MDLLLYILALALLVFAGFMVGFGLGSHDSARIKDENARLNAELHKLTDRDERGRFKGGK